MPVYRYVFEAGDYESKSIYLHGDAAAKLVADRWIRLFWRRYVLRLRDKHAGSMAQSTAEGWHKPPTAILWRWTESKTWPGAWSATADRVLEWEVPNWKVE